MRALAVKLVRLTGMGAVVGIVGIAAIYGGWRFCLPYAQEWQTRGEVASLQRRVNALDAEHRRLQRQARLLATPEGIKIEARRLGLLKPGERSLRFMTQPRPRAAPAPPKPSSPGLWQRVRDWKKTVFSGKSEPTSPDRASPPQPRDPSPARPVPPGHARPDPAVDD